MPIRRLLLAAFAYTAALSAFGTPGLRAGTPNPSDGSSVTIYAAGSLTAAMQELITASGIEAASFAKPTFGPAGLLRERLEKGEAADLFASADLAAPVRVAASHPGALVVPFARNRMCVAAKPALGLTADNLLDKMLSPDLRLATSTPGADPGGDYARAVFRQANAVRPGADAILSGKMLTLVGGPNTMAPVNGHPPSAAIFLDNKADLFLYYCSSAAGLLKDVPDLVNVALPDALEVHPTYGLAVLTDKPVAARFALFILSQKGQAILAHAGFEPLVPLP